MDVNEAVDTAYKYIQKLFANERISNLGLEEVELIPEENTWAVTMGFSRECEQPTTTLPPGYNSFGERKPVRTYKKVLIDNGTKNVKAVKIRQVSE